MRAPRGKTFLREWRKHRGLSLPEAAERAGTSHPNLSKVERGLVPYNQDILEALALVYGCDPADLLIRDPSAPPNLYSLLARADEQQRRQIFRVAEAITDFHGQAPEAERR
jgi:transcriptional regulator with XRE-family HTH domain